MATEKESARPKQGRDLRRRRIITAALILVAAPVVTLVCFLLYLSASDLSGWRDTAARIASDAMGRELTIAGDFEVDVGLVTRVRATELALANAGWGSETEMMSIDRLDAEVDIWPLISGSIHMPTVIVEGGRALFESSAAEGSNWAFGTGDESADDGPIRLQIDRIRARDVSLVFRAQQERPDLDLVVDALDSTGDDRGHHQVVANGSLRGVEVVVTGVVGPLDGLVNLAAIEHDFEILVGGAVLRSAGSIGDLDTLSSLDLEATASIPEPDEVTALLGLPATGSGPLTLEVAAANVTELTSLTATVIADAITARVDGTVDSLTTPTDLDLEFKATGPDIRPLASLSGIDGVAASPFSVKGHVRWRGFPIEIEGLEIEVGDNRLSADGRLGAPPLMLDTDFRFHGAGPNIAALAALGGKKLPADRFALDGRLARVEHGLQVEAVEASVGRTTLSASGFVGDPPHYTGTDLAFAAKGPNLGHFSSAAGVDLPAEAFDVTGRLSDGGDDIALSGVRTRVGSNTLSLDGRVTTESGMMGTDLTLVADGPDLSAVGSAAGIEGLPKAPFHVTGNFAVERGGYRLRNVEGRLADLEFVVDGLVTRDAGLSGTELRVETHGADLAHLSSVFGGPSLPTEPFRAKGDIEVLAHGYSLQDVELELGSARGRIDGKIGAAPEFDGTGLHIEVRGPSLAIARPMIPADLNLPVVGFDVGADVAMTGGELRVSKGSLVIDGNTVTVEGAVVPRGDLTGSAIDLTVHGPDFASVGRLVSAVLNQEWPALPSLEYSISGSLAADDGGYRFEPLIGTLGRARAEVAGRVGSWPELAGTELSLNIDGPDASLFQALARTEIPVAPFRAVGRVAVTERGYAFDNLQLQLGAFRGEIDGSAGPPPTLAGTDLTVRVNGPNLALVGDLAGRPGLPELPFHLAGRFEGDPRRFEASSIEAGLGSSDVSGGFTVDLEAKPFATCSLHSDRIDLPELRRASDDGGGETTEPIPAPPRGRHDSLLPDTPIDLAALELFDLDLNWGIEELAFRLNSYRNVGLTAALHDGRLELTRFEAVGSHGGELRTEGVLEPIPEGYRVRTHLVLEGARVNLADESADPSRYAPADVEVNLTASGSTLHELAASTNGRLMAVVGEGVLANSVVDLVAADVLVTLLTALNPFAKDEADTRLNCAVIVANFDNGVMTLEPAVIQTDKMTILGNGTIDFATEKLKLDWVTKPRKGIGLSASAITNPYIRLGGTLADPALEMKPIEALATTGVAVATAGLSILGKGLLDRITAEKKVCEQAMAQAEKQLQPEQPKKKKRR